MNEPTNELAARVTRVEKAYDLLAQILSEQLASMEAVQAATAAFLNVSAGNELVRQAMETKFEQSYANAIATSLNSFFLARLEGDLKAMRKELGSNAGDEGQNAAN